MLFDLKNLSAVLLFFLSAVLWASQVALVVKKKNPPANARDIRAKGSIPGSGKSPGEGHSNHSSILVWKIPWTEEPGRL